MTIRGERSGGFETMKRSAMVYSAHIRDIDRNGNIVHIELKTADGETVEGVYELIGWTKPPKDVKARVELEIWVPPKATHSIN
jgi:hypothetical protein